jgi:hypothetical protein
VAVLWIDEEELESQPLRRISTMLRAFRRVAGTPLEVGMVGPTRSNELAVLLAELSGRPRDLDESDSTPCPSPSLLEDAANHPVPLYSPWATMPIDERPPLKEPCPLRIIRTIGDDSALREAIRHELDLRRIATQKIALVVEWGTDYGEALVDLFASNEDGGEARDATPRAAGGRRSLGGVAIYRFGRELDGYVPMWGSSSDSRSKEKEQAPAPAADTPSDAPRQTGTNRLDFVARLRQLPDWQRFEAVGILCTDIYDKILLLRALRQVCPRAHDRSRRAAARPEGARGDA